MPKIERYSNGLLVSTKRPIETLDKVPPAIYELFQTPDGEFILHHRTDKYTLPKEIYGISHKEHFSIIGDLYEARSEEGENTGVLLCGEKGSGKTLLAEAVANKMVETGRPVIFINKVFNADALSALVKIIGPCMLFFDEFEKVYSEPMSNSSVSRDEDYNPYEGTRVQNELLTFFSSNEFSGVLSILVSNSPVSEFLSNRPQRILLNFSYDNALKHYDCLMASEQLKFDNYMKHAIRSSLCSEVCMNMDSVMEIHKVWKRHFNPDIPTTHQRTADILLRMNVSFYLPRKLTSIKVLCADKKYIGKRVVVKHNSDSEVGGVLCQIIDIDTDKVVFSKEVSYRNPHIHLVGCNIIIGFGGVLPCGDNFIHDTCEYVIGEDSVQTLHEVERNVAGGEIQEVKKFGEYPAYRPVMVPQSMQS